MCSVWNVHPPRLGTPSVASRPSSNVYRRTRRATSPRSRTVLSRVASADHDISDAEAAQIERLVRDTASLSANQATLVVQIARTQQRLFGGTDDFLVTRELAEMATDDQKLAIVDCLFAVAAADQSVRVVETNEIAKIARQLLVDPSEMARLRLKYRDHLAARHGVDPSPEK